jgi:peptide/nickel transport system permease protein
VSVVAYRERARIRLRPLSVIGRDPELIGALVLLAILIGLALLGPLLWRQNPDAINLAAALEHPSRAHPMGTDEVGRDVFARFNTGARISLAVGAIVVVVGTVVGAAIGLIAGTMSGWPDNVLMRAMDAVLAFPPLILAMAVTVGLGVGLKSAVIGITLTTVPYYARLVRSDVIRIRALSFVEAAIALGASRTRTIIRHIVPHLASTLLIQSAAAFGYAILSVAALGFIGLGAQVPTPEWGTMITEGFQYILTKVWWIGVFPGIGLLLTVTATNIIADRMRDRFDPRGEFAQV